MRRALILLAFSPLLGAQSGIPRAQCDFTSGRDAVRAAEQLARRAPVDLFEGRERGERLTTMLRGAVPIFLGCDCPQLAERTAEAAGLAAQLPAEASMARMVQGYEQLRLRITFAREQMERQACR